MKMQEIDCICILKLKKKREPSVLIRQKKTNKQTTTKKVTQYAHCITQLATTKGVIPVFPGSFVPQVNILLTHIK